MRAPPTADSERDTDGQDYSMYPGNQERGQYLIFRGGRIHSVEATTFVICRVLGYLASGGAETGRGKNVRNPGVRCTHVDYGPTTAV